MARQDDLERYESAEAQDILRLFEAARPLQHGTPPPNFRAQILQKIDQPRGRQRIRAWFTGAVMPAWAPVLAAMLLLSLGMNAWLGSSLLGRRDQGPEVAVSDTIPLPSHADAFQENLQYTGNLGTLAHEHAMAAQPMFGYGFAAKPAPTRSFLLGTLYAEALAYVRGGQLQAAAQRWTAIETELGQMAAPWTTYIHHMRTQLQQPSVSPETVRASLALFEPLYEAFAERAVDATLPLFRAGTWLTNMRLAAGAGDTASLRTPDAVRYFQREMRRLQAPQGVRDALDRLGPIVEQEELSARDITAVLKHLTKIQQLLG